MQKIILVISFTAFVSTQSFCQWEKLNFPGCTPFTLVETPQGLLAANYHVIYRSTNNGTAWDSLSSISSLGISKMFQIGDVLLANTSRMIIWPVLIPSVFRSDNLGHSWYPVLDGVYGGSSIAFSNSKVFVDLDGDLYCSADTGKTWIMVNTDSTFPNNVAEIISDGNSLYARIQAEALYKSKDDALTWDSLKTNIPKNFYNVVVQDSCVYVGTFSNGFYISKDGGITWSNSSVGLPDSAGIRSLYIYRNNIIASISKDFQQSVYRYRLEDNVWHTFNEGFSLRRTGYIHALANNNEYIFLASDSAIWRRPLSDLITDVAESNDELLTDIFLFQNFPNPFNPTTTIKFSIRNLDFVTLKVFDILGKVVATLVNKEMVPGTYEVKFDGSNLSSGIYFYRLQTGNFSNTKKLLLIK
jgi:hypothetical protein